MGHFSLKIRTRWLLSGALLVALIFFAWVYGWGGGPINVMNFSAEDVDYIKIYGPIQVAKVSEKDEIQSVIDAVNSFRHTGNELKLIPKYGLFLGGTALYEFRVFLLDGEEFEVTFGLNNASQPPADTEVSYWFPGRGKIIPFSSTCRGSMELFYELLEKGSKVNGF
ncbi:MAG: hypothetical protein HFF90_07845 [Oscillibacter sp.]|nr:hypothetical protein [Oscillibacter sp.]